MGDAADAVGVDGDGPLLRPVDFGSRTRLSAKALRLYAEQGLLVPAHVDQRTGYRWYSSSQTRRARLIGLLRQAGMPLSRIRTVVDLDAARIGAEARSWWAGVESDVRAQRALVHAIGRHLDHEEEPVYDIDLRDVPERTLLSAERRLTVESLEPFVREATAAVTDHLDAAGIVDRDPVRVVFHGLVTEDSDGPVEVAVPFVGSVAPVGELRVRLQHAGREAFVALSREQADFPAILGAYDALGEWVEQQGLTRAGSPAEVHLPGGPEEHFLDVTWPVA